MKDKFSPDNDPFPNLNDLLRSKFDKDLSAFIAHFFFHEHAIKDTELQLQRQTDKHKSQTLGILKYVQFFLLKKGSRSDWSIDIENRFKELL